MIWEEKSRYNAALRLEPYRDGFLLSGLQTRSEERGKGFASKLVLAALEFMKVDGIKILYSHVDKKNDPSFSLHSKFGFQVYSNHAILLDGSVSNKYYTLTKII